MTDALVVAIKLLVGLSAFVVIGWYGARDKRIGGVLLTFPLLTGIAMLTGADPLGIAGTVYPVVIWNSALFLVVMVGYDYLPPLPAWWDDEARLVARVVVWMALWAVGAAVFALLRERLSFAGPLFLIQLLFAALYVWRLWRAPLAPSFPTFGEMWFNWRGAVRAAFFVVAFLILLGIAHFNQDARWVGWASGLPLPGAFAVAMLSVAGDKKDLLSLGDTVLLGPLLVIPFTWLLSHAILHLRLAGAGGVAEMATVVLFWIGAGAIAFVLVPRFASWRDGVRSKR